LQYLSEARKLGDYLIVGLNSDKSVRHLGKGDNRPINGQDSRAAMLAAMEFVDAVVIFDEDTPYELLSNTRPDILVKGGDYGVDEIIGREFAGETRVLPFKSGFSTTGLIERIRGRC
jgi:D-beta-D-heptose 7-phosphate kinase/D-beta-D-heptose 1-phosphate adenosyltransferase